MSAMPIQCNFCLKDFPNSTTIGSRHKSVCLGWLETLTKAEPCLCGHTTNTSAMMKHRRSCETWQLRDKVSVRSGRWRAGIKAKYGVETWRQIPGLEEKRQGTLLEKYGATNIFCKESTLYDAIEEKRAPLRGCFATGADNPMNNPDFKAKQIHSLVQNYGVVHPLQSPILQERLKETCLTRYGVESTGAIPSAIEKRIITNWERYGGPAPACDPKIVQKMIEGVLRPGPNKIETRLAEAEPRLSYTGNGDYWIFLPRLQGHKNPDFILPGLDPELPKRGVSKVVEIFGDYWHSEKFTGQTVEVHEAEMIEAYAEVGIKCLVIWEKSIKKKFSEVCLKVAAFIES